MADSTSGCNELTWFPVVLEIYEPDEGWPSEGKVADWVHEHKVGFCEGSTENLILLTPLPRILWGKLKFFVTELWWSLTWRFHKVDFGAWDALSDEAFRLFEEQLD